MIKGKQVGLESNLIVMLVGRAEHQSTDNGCGTIHKRKQTISSGIKTGTNAT